MTAKDIFKLAIRLGGVWLLLQAFWRLIYGVFQAAGVTLSTTTHYPLAASFIGCAEYLVPAILLLWGATRIADVVYRRDA
jgi:hypothetical protein